MTAEVPPKPHPGVKPHTGSVSQYQHSWSTPLVCFSLTMKPDFVRVAWLHETLRGDHTSICLLGMSPTAALDPLTVNDAQCRAAYCNNFEEAKSFHPSASKQPGNVHLSSSIGSNHDRLGVHAKSVTKCLDRSQFACEPMTDVAHQKLQIIMYTVSVASQLTSKAAC